MIYSCLIILFEVMLLIMVPIVICSVLLIMFVVVVPHALVPIVVYSVFICTALLLMRTGTLALLCHSNQCVAHYVCRGGYSRIGTLCGVFCIDFDIAAPTVFWGIAAVLSFKSVCCSLCYARWCLK